MPNKALVKFIKEARKRGFDDYQIREPLIKHGWPLEEIEKAFNFLKPKYKYKNKVSIFLDNEILKKLERRAKKNMFTLPEQIEDILRRSILSQRKSTQEEKLDDKFLAYFSRRK
ncbi:MAG: hypothetical protein AABX29_06420, partial [Nanoarchaeota archaeon]